MFGIALVMQAAIDMNDLTFNLEMKRVGKFCSEGPANLAVFNSIDFWIALKFSF